MFIIEITENQNTSLKQVSIKNEELDFIAIIYPNLGASLQQLNINNVTIIDGIIPNEEGLETYANRYNSSLLFPFPNRISGGKYTFENQEYQLHCNDTGFNNALHGFVYNKPFEISKLETNEKSALVELDYMYNGKIEGFPFPFILKVTYIFNQNSVEIKFNVTNTGTDEFPFGLGWHPYFKVEDLSKAFLNFEGKNQFIMNSKMIPDSTRDIKHKLPIHIGNLELDDCFTLAKSNCSLITNKYTANISFLSEENYQFLQIYTPPNRKSIAIEPMTCIGNSFNHKIGLKTIKPQEVFEWKIDLEITF